MGYQMIASYSSGQSNNLQEAFNSVNWKTVATYTVAGAVAGATFGAINPAATVLAGAVAGSISSAAGGQAAALTEAAIDVGEEVVTGERPETSYGMEFITKAHGAGFLDGDQIMWDMGSGAVFGGLGQGVANLANSTGGATYVTRAARSENALLPGIIGAGTQAFSKATEEITRKWLDTKFKHMEEILK
jgi:hypothetical protein